MEIGFGSFIMESSTFVSLKALEEDVTCSVVLKRSRSLTKWPFTETLVRWVSVTLRPQRDRPGTTSCLTSRKDSLCLFYCARVYCCQGKRASRPPKDILQSRYIQHHFWRAIWQQASKGLRCPYSFTQQVHTQKITSKNLSKCSHRDLTIGTFICAFLKEKKTNLEIHTMNICGYIQRNIYVMLWNNSKHQCSQISVCAQLRLALCCPMDCSLLGCSVHEIFQARILG